MLKTNEHFSASFHSNVQVLPQSCESKRENGEDSQVSRSTHTDGPPAHLLLAIYYGSWTCYHCFNCYESKSFLPPHHRGSHNLFERLLHKCIILPTQIILWWFELLLIKHIPWLCRFMQDIRIKIYQNALRYLVFDFCKFYSWLIFLQLFTLLFNLWQSMEWLVKYL